MKCRCCNDNVTRYDFQTDDQLCENCHFDYTESHDEPMACLACEGTSMEMVHNSRTNQIEEHPCSSCCC